MGAVTKLAANYRLSNKPDASCGICANFIPPDKCEVVAGVISVRGLSDLFTPLETTAEAKSSTPTAPDLTEFFTGVPNA